MLLTKGSLLIMQRENKISQPLRMTYLGITNTYFRSMM